MRDIRVAKHWNSIPRETWDSPFLEVCKSRLDIHLVGMV